MPGTHTALPFLAFQPSTHQSHLAKALVGVGEEKRNLLGWVMTSSWHMAQNQLKPLACGLRPWRTGIEGGAIPASFLLAAPVAWEAKGWGSAGHRSWIKYMDKGANCFHLTPASSLRNETQGSQKSQSPQSHKLLPPPCRHLLSPKAPPEDLVRKLRNIWVCGDKPYVYAL